MEEQIQEGYLNKKCLSIIAIAFMYPSCFRHSYVQLQTVRSQRYQLYVLYYNTASNAHFMNCHLL